MSPLESADFAFWQSLAGRDPAAAARELRHRVDSRLTPAARSAAIAWLADESRLAETFARGIASRGPLAGIPYFLKDLFDLAGVATRAGSCFLADVRPMPTADSAIVADLAAAGAVVGGKTHLHEFALGLTGENRHFGDSPHPRFPDRLSGGSSSGSAVAVAAGITPFAVGTDTGGSIRVPAAWCGLYGWRRAPGDHWIRDAFPLSPSCDTIGWLAGSATDLRLLLDWSEHSKPSSREPRGAYLSLGKPDAEVTEACWSAAESFSQPIDSLLLAELKEVFAPAPEIYRDLTAAEAARIHAPWLDEHRSGYSPEVWDRIDYGRQLDTATLEQQDAACDALRRSGAGAFKEYDFLVLPAVPCGALTKAEATPANRRRILELTAPASIGGWPVLTLPVTLPSGLTAGLQVVVPTVDSPVPGWILDHWDERASRLSP